MDRNRSTATRRRFLAGGAATALAAANGGCLFRRRGGAGGESTGATPGTSPGSGSVETPTAGDPPLEVVHGWTGGPSADAISSLADAFRERHPDLDAELEPVSDPANDTHADVVQRRIDGGHSPGIFAATPGANLRRFAGSVSTSLHERVWDGTSLGGAALPVAGELCRLDGTRAAVPLSAMRTSALFYDVGVLEEAGVDPSGMDSVDAFLAALDAVATTTDAVPFAHGLDEQWPTLQLFATLLVAREGVDPYRAVLDGEPDTGAVERTFETIATLLADYATESATNRSWQEANDRVVDGSAAFVQQGTWAGKGFESAGGSYDDGWGVRPFPGTAGTPIVHFESFVAPAENPTPARAEQWLSFAGSADGQTAFNRPYGGVPARDDVPSDALDAFQSAVYGAVVDADRQLPALAHGDGLPPRTVEAVSEAVGRTVGPETDVDAATSAFVDAVR